MKNMQSFFKDIIVYFQHSRHLCNFCLSFELSFVYVWNLSHNYSEFTLDPNDDVMIYRYSFLIE